MYDVLIALLWTESPMTSSAISIWQSPSLALVRDKRLWTAMHSSGRIERSRLWFITFSRSGVKSRIRESGVAFSAWFSLICTTSDFCRGPKRSLAGSATYVCRCYSSWFSMKIFCEDWGILEASGSDLSLICLTACCRGLFWYAILYLFWPLCGGFPSLFEFRRSLFLGVWLRLDLGSELGDDYDLGALLEDLHDLSDVLYNWWVASAWRVCSVTCDWLIA